MKRVLLLLLFLSTITLIGCSCSCNSIHGSGNKISKNFELSSFDIIDASNAFEIDVTVGNEQSIKVLADDNIMEYVKVFVRDNKLFLGMKDNFSYDGEIKVIISVPELKGVDLSGACKIDIKKINAENFYLDVSGACKGNLSGTVSNLSFDLSGATKLNSVELIAENVFADMSGASKLTIYCSNKLTIDASGASKIRVLGNPKIKETDFSGASSISYE